jgi:hypothetical protein
MAEEYRLLHRGRSEPASAGRSLGTSGSTRASADKASRTGAKSHHHARRHTPSVWRWLTRLFAGGPAL